ncbi:MAG: glycoside hydrolase family 172 protein, partial [Planctomycetota bacterium JB042]
VRTWSRAEAPPLPTLEAAPRGRETTARVVEGPGVVRRLEVDLPDDEETLRRETLELRVDGETTVLAPLGDFFGTAPGRNAYRSLPMGITEDGVGWCAFPMPFGERFEVVSPPGVRLRVTDDVRPYRFHARWRGDPALPTRPMRDWPVVHVRGEGRLVGAALAVTNPVKGWWGEGDEKISVDGEPFPSTFGTGTEDYFGYAWCDTALFDAPYHAQSRCDGPINRGHCAVHRFHVLDDVPFRTSLRFDLEVWHWVDCVMAFATTAYWYAAPGATHDVPPPTDHDRTIVRLPPIPRVEGAIEGESFRVVERSAGTCAPQDLGFAEGFSGESHLWWRDAGPDDTLKVAFPAPRGGARRLVLRLTRAPDYGIVRLAVNGRVLAERIDLYAPRVEPDEERTFDAVPLVEGENELSVRIVGTNPAARPKNHMFGIDYVRLPD